MFKLVVLSCIMAAASAVSPLLYGGYVSPLAYSAPLLQPYNYRGPLSLAPGQPANILGADGRPLDTLDVNLDRSAHLTAKALDGVHFLKKRSAAWVGAPLAYSAVAAPLAYSAVAAPIAYSAALVQPSNYRGPLSLAPGQPANILAADGRPLDTLDVNLDRAAHITAKALNNGVHLLKKRSAAWASAPIAYSSVAAPLAYSAVAAPIAYSATLVQPSNYRGPLSLAPGQPANILAADGRPLDTLDVNLDRAAHITAKALNNGVHLLKKRSAAWTSAPIAYSATLVQPSNYRGPLSLAPGQPANILAADGRPLDTLDVNLDRAAHITAKALNNGVHLLKKRSAAWTSAPIAYSAVAAPLAYSAVAAPVAYSAALVQPSNYRGPLSLAPGQPASILAADGRPLDTLDVNLDRAAHLSAKALDNGIHLLKKRSAWPYY